MKLIYVCSPYRGNMELNTARARRYCRFVYTEGAIPLAPHLHNTQFLDESLPDEREAGLKLGLQLLRHCDELWLFGDLLSEGMEAELYEAQRLKMTIKYYTDNCTQREVNSK